MCLILNYSFIMKKILIVFLLLLSACTSHQYNKVWNIQKNIDLPAISNWVNKWILVWVSDSHSYSKTWPKIYSWSYYFNPSNFYIYPVDISVFKQAYSWKFDNNPVYYYDENDGAQAWMVVYVLRNIYHKKNVSLLLNSNVKKTLKFGEKYKNISDYIKSSSKLFTWWFVWTWRFLVAYNTKLIKFTTGDLLLYSSDIWTMKDSNFYKISTWVNIQAFDWTKLVDFNWNLKSKKEIDKLLKPLQLNKYKKIYIYYPKFWYRSGLLALYLQNYFSKR